MTRTHQLDGLLALGATLSSAALPWINFGKDQASLCILATIPIVWLASHSGFRSGALATGVTSVMVALADAYRTGGFLMPVVNSILFLATLLLASHWISTTKAQLDHFKKASITDQLTNLTNRAGLKSVGTTAFIEAKKTLQPLTALMIDCDSFKEINDRYGHQAGDEVLTVLAGVLRQNVRNADLVFRLGGDEFFVVLVGVDSHDTDLVIRKIEDRFRRGVQELGFDASLSIGTIFNAQAEDSLERVVELADEKMYRRKNDKKESVIAQFWS